jgi:hypothetical protein
MNNQAASWESFNDFLLYGATDRFAKILSRYELFKRVAGVPGDIVECGVFKGTGVLFWAKLIQIFHPLSLRKVVGFDTYAPTRAALEALYDSVVPGGVVVCDEYGLSGCSESDAVDDFLRVRGLSAVRLRSIRWNLSPMAWFVKP